MKVFLKSRPYGLGVHGGPLRLLFSDVRIHLSALAHQNRTIAIASDFRVD